MLEETDIEELAIEFGQASEAYRERWERSGHDPFVLAEYIKSYHYAIQVPWVTQEIQRLMMLDPYKVAQLFRRGQGKRADQNSLKTAMLDYMIYDMVDDLVKTGLTKTAAFEELSHEPIDGKYLEQKVIAKYYYRATKRKPEIFWEENLIAITIHVIPARVVFFATDPERRVRIYGHFTLRFDKFPNLKQRYLR